jgi:hypothetical protein
VKSRVLCFIVLCLLSIHYAQDEQLPFNAEHVVEKVRQSRVASVTRQGEFMLDTCCTLVSALGNQDVPDVAFDGTNYLVVWGRSGVRPGN